MDPNTKHLISGFLPIPEFYLLGIQKVQYSGPDYLNTELGRYLYHHCRLMLPSVVPMI